MGSPYVIYNLEDPMAEPSTAHQTKVNIFQKNDLKDLVVYGFIIKLQQRDCEFYKEIVGRHFSCCIDI